jgi:hypothetical protein
MPNRPPEDYRAEADLCRSRAAGCRDPKLAQEWRNLAAEYDRIALIAESQAVKIRLDA